MKISAIKVAVKWLFGGTEAVLDYVLDIANNAVAGLSDATKENIQQFNSTASSILSTLNKYKAWCPEKWRTAYADTVGAFQSVCTATADLKVTADEIGLICNSFKTAYADWRAE